jgi:hypothetical protein
LIPKLKLDSKSAKRKIQPNPDMKLTVIRPMKQPVYAKLPFGQWAQVLLGPINRGRRRLNQIWLISQKKQGAAGITTAAPYVASQWGRGDDRLLGQCGSPRNRSERPKLFLRHG